MKTKLKGKDRKLLKQIEQIDEINLKKFNLQQPTIHDCIQFLAENTEKNIKDFSSKEIVYRQAIMDNLVEFSLSKDLPDLKEDFENKIYKITVCVTIVVVSGNIISMFLIPNLFYILSMIGFDIYIIVSLIRLYLYDEDIKWGQSFLKFLKRRKEKNG